MSSGMRITVTDEPDFASRRSRKRRKSWFGSSCCRVRSEDVVNSTRISSDVAAHSEPPINPRHHNQGQLSQAYVLNDDSKMGSRQKAMRGAKVEAARHTEEHHSVITQVQKDADAAAIQRRGKDIADTLDLGNFLTDTLKGPYLGDQRDRDKGKKTLVLDLDETLVHSSFKPIPNADFVMPVEIEGLVYDIFVTKRPGVEEFLCFVAELYEVVIFTASLAKYADPLLDKLDPQRLCAYRLFRESCLPWDGIYVKDLSRLGRDLKNVVIVDNSPSSSMLQPDNSLPIKSWFDDQSDRELYELIPILRALATVDDIPEVLRRITTCEDDISSPPIH